MLFYKYLSSQTSGYEIIRGAQRETSKQTNKQTATQPERTREKIKQYKSIIVLIHTLLKFNQKSKENKKKLK